MRAVPNYPGGPRRVRLPASFPVPRGLPRIAGGSASAALLSRPARASLTLRPACLLNRPRRPLSQGSSPLLSRLPVSYSTKPATIEVEPSSTGDTRLRGAPQERSVLRRYHAKEWRNMLRYSALRVPPDVADAPSGLRTASTTRPRAFRSRISCIAVA